MTILYHFGIIFSCTLSLAFPEQGHIPIFSMTYIQNFLIFFHYESPALALKKASTSSKSGMDGCAPFF